MGFRPSWLPKKKYTTDHDTQALPPDSHSSYTLQILATMVEYPLSLDSSSYSRQNDNNDSTTSSKASDDDDEIEYNKTKTNKDSIPWQQQ